jgi:hypothetical protein
VLEESLGVDRIKIGAVKKKKRKRKKRGRRKKKGRGQHG